MEPLRLFCWLVHLHSLNKPHFTRQMSLLGLLSSFAACSPEATTYEYTNNAQVQHYIDKGGIPASR